MSKQLTKAIWEVMANRVTDAMKVYTRPFVTILAGAKDIGTGTFVDRVGPAVLTCGSHTTKTVGLPHARGHGGFYDGGALREGQAAC